MHDTMPSIVSWGPGVLIALAFLYAIFLYPHVRILRRTGHSGWWALGLLIPVVNVALI